LPSSISKNIEDKLGVPYPDPNEEMPEDMEVEISRLAAAGAQKLLQANQAMMAQQQAQQAAHRTQCGADAATRASA
jgi:hypothetical protein